MLGGIRSAKSKDSKRKLRRWTFAGIITKADGEQKGANMPGLMYGDHQEAQTLADRIRTAYLEGEKDNVSIKDCKIVPVPHETVSMETKRQFEGLNDQATLVMKACFILATNLEAAGVNLITGEKVTPEILVKRALEEARQSLFPKLNQVLDKMTPTEPVPPDPEEEAKKNRVRGIEAVRAALDAPLEEAAA